MKAQIHFTLGPSLLGSPSALEDVIIAGSDACRINLSHTRVAELPDLFSQVRRAALATGRSVRTGADLRGRKLRIGPLSTGTIQLDPGQSFDLIPVASDLESPGNIQRASVNCPTLGEIVAPGDLVLLDDGAISMRVENARADQVQCVVEIGGELPERSGFNLPTRRIRLPAITAKDESDLDALAHLQPDFVYLSYVEAAEDILELRQSLTRRKLKIPIVAKIERAVALDHLEEIAAVSDALCIARGDLGVEVQLARLPYVQRQIVSAARQSQTPVFLAGEVLLTLVGRSVPSRAEATDVFVATEQGVAGFVLSDETAVGWNPTGAVQWLRRMTDEASSYVMPTFTAK